MSVWLPRFRPRNTHVIEFEDLNETLQEAIEETAGRLNEHNWKAGAFARSLVASDAAYKLYQIAVEDDPKSGGFPSANTHTMPTRMTWELVTSMTKNIVTTGGVAWILFSAQVVGTDTALFALRVDGQIIPESILGSIEDNAQKVGPPNTQAVVCQAIAPVLGSVTIDVVCFPLDSTSVNMRVAHRELIIVVVER